VITADVPLAMLWLDLMVKTSVGSTAITAFDKLIRSLSSEATHCLYSNFKSMLTTFLFRRSFN